MTGEGSTPASAPIPGSLEPKIMPGQIAGHMRGRLLLPAEGFGIGPGKVQRAAVERFSLLPGQHNFLHSAGYSSRSSWECHSQF